MHAGEFNGAGRRTHGCRALRFSRTVEDLSKMASLHSSSEPQPMNDPPTRFTNQHNQHRFLGEFGMLSRRRLCCGGSNEPSFVSGLAIFHDLFLYIACDSHKMRVLCSQSVYFVRYYSFPGCPLLGLASLVPIESFDVLIFGGSVIYQHQVMM